MKMRTIIFVLMVSTLFVPLLEAMRGGHGGGMHSGGMVSGGMRGGSFGRGGEGRGNWRGVGRGNNGNGETILEEPVYYDYDNDDYDYYAGPVFVGGGVVGNGGWNRNYRGGSRGGSRTGSRGGSRGTSRGGHR